MLRNADWSKWGPLTFLVVLVTIVVVVFTAVYLIVTQPSTAAVIGFLKAVGEFLGATGLIGVAHALLGRSDAPTAPAGGLVVDPEVARSSADVPDEAEFDTIPRPESAVQPDAPPNPEAPQPAPVSA